MLQLTHSGGCMKSQQSRFHVPVWLFTIIYSGFYLVSPVAGIASPDDTTTEISPLYFRSTYTHYQKFSETPILSWREANDAVEKIGGWRFYAKEVTLPDAADASTDHKNRPQVKEPAKPSTSTTPHSGHEVKP